MKVKDKQGNEVEIEDSVAEQIVSEAESRVRAEVAGEVKSLKDTVKELKDSNTGLVDQVKELRKENRAPESTDTNKAPVDVESEVDKILAKRRAAEAKENKAKAIELFKSKYKEFHPENDQGGLKFKLVEDELAILNLDGLYTVEEFLARIEKAKQLAMPESQKEETVPLDPSNPGGDANPRSRQETKLSPAELNAVKQLGWTEERFLKLKEAQPLYVDRLLRETSSL